jgi:hypothetical protein
LVNLKIQKSQPFGKLAFSPKFDHLLFTTPMNTLFCLYSEAFSLYNPTYPPIYNLFQNQKSTNSASTSKIQSTTLPTFVFSVSASGRKKWGYERKLLDSWNQFQQ